MKNRNPFLPDLEVNRVTDIDFELLLEREIQGILLDLDNTLTVWHGMQVESEVIAWLEKAKVLGFRLCIVSNSYAARVQPMGDLLSIAVLPMSGKPRKRAFIQGCRKLGLEPKQVAMVGDQIFTDIFGANRAGLTTILTNPIDSVEMWATAHISRPAERLLRRYLARR